MPIAGYLLQTCGYALALLSPACALYALCCPARHRQPVPYGCICCSPYTLPGSYIFSQTLFSMRMGIDTPLMGAIIAGAHQTGC